MKPICKRLLIGQILVCMLLSAITLGQFAKEEKLYHCLKTQYDTFTHITTDNYVYKQPQTASHARSQSVTNVERTWKYRISGEEYELLQKLVEAEAGGEPTDGKILVANVVLNRVNSKKFPQTVYGVIMQQDASGAQFSPVRDGRIHSVHVSKQTKEAVDEALMGKDISSGALYFVAKNKARADKVSWFDARLQYVTTCGGHTFYK